MRASGHHHRKRSRYIPERGVLTHTHTRTLLGVMTGSTGTGRTGPIPGSCCDHDDRVQLQHQRDKAENDNVRRGRILPATSRPGRDLHCRWKRGTYWIRIDRSTLKSAH